MRPSTAPRTGSSSSNSAELAQTALYVPLTDEELAEATPDLLIAIDTIVD